MAFQAIQFPSQINQQEPSYFERSQGMQKAEHMNDIFGAEAQYAPQNEAQKYAQSQSKSFMDQLEAQYKEQQIISKLKLEHAEALHHAQQAKGGNQYAPHDFEKLETYHDKQVAKYGAESEQAKRSKMAIEGYISSHGEGRFAPSMLGKMQNERDALAARLGPEHPDVKAYDLRLLKEQSDVDTRQRSLLASNLEKSMDALNSDDLTRYSGPGGQTQLAFEKAQDMITGKPSEEYKRYLEALVASEYETSELRQFFKESKDKEVRKHLAILSNPTSWGKSPAAAKSQLEKSRSIVRKQLHTFRGGITGTEEHLGTKGKEEALNKVEGAQKQYAPATEEEIQHAMAEYGKSREEILRLMGGE
jgi:hypothetical protein